MGLGRSQGDLGTRVQPGFNLAVFHGLWGWFSLFRALEMRKVSANFGEQSVVCFLPTAACCTYPGRV